MILTRVTWLFIRGFGGNTSKWLRISGKLDVWGDLRFRSVQPSNQETFLTIDNQGFITKRELPNDILDGDNQTLSIAGNILSITNGNSVTLPGGLGDNLGNHTATTNLDMNQKNIEKVANINFDPSRDGGIVDPHFLLFNQDGTITGQNLELIAVSKISLDAWNGGVNIDPVDPANVTHALNVEGAVCATQYDCASDARLKRNVSVIPDAMEKINQLHGVTYEFMEENEFNVHLPQTTQAGLIAQELEKVLPEAVRETDLGFKTVSYDMVIPLLIEAIKEQNQVIEDLTGRIESLEAKSTNAYTRQGMSVSLEEASQFKVHPNPFTQDIQVTYVLPEKFTTAYLELTDINGKLIGTEILQANTNTVNLGGYNIAQGMYQLTLIVDGKVIGTKKIIKK